MTEQELKELNEAYGKAIFQLKVAQAQVEALEKKLVEYYNASKPNSTTKTE